MRYYTLTQERPDITSVLSTAKEHPGIPTLVLFLSERGIGYTQGVDFASELKQMGYKKDNPRSVGGDYLVYTFVVLANEEDILAMMLHFDGVQKIKNRFTLKIINFGRSLFDWML